VYCPTFWSLEQSGLDKKTGDYGQRRVDRRKTRGRREQLESWNKKIAVLNHDGAAHRFLTVSRIHQAERLKAKTADKRRGTRGAGDRRQ